MEKICKLIIGFLVPCMIFIACKKDDNTAPEEKIDLSKNYFKAGDVEYTLSFGALENYGPDDEDDDWNYDGYNLDLVLFSSGITATSGDDGSLYVSGIGQIIYFEMFTSKGTELDNGDYIFDRMSPFPVGSFSYGDYATDWNSNNNNNEWFEFTSGKVTVSKSGDEYTLIIRCTDEDGVNVTGHFKGALQYYTYETPLKSTLNQSKKRR